MKFTSQLPPEPQVPFNSLKSGDMFRLAHISLNDALRTGGFFIHAKPTPQLFYACFSIASSEIQAISPGALVIKHTATLNIDS